MHDIVANHTHGVVLADVTAQRDGKTYNQKSLVYHLTDGKVTGVREWIEDQDADKDFWGEPEIFRWVE